MSNAKMPSRAWKNKRSPDFEAAAPKDLNDAEKIRWANVARAAEADVGSLIDCGARVMAQNPGVYEEFMRLHRNARKQEVSVHIAGCPTLLDSSPEFIQKILTIPVVEMSNITHAMRAMQKCPEPLSIAEVREVMDQASVLSVMDDKTEEDADLEDEVGYAVTGG